MPHGGAKSGQCWVDSIFPALCGAARKLSKSHLTEPGRRRQSSSASSEVSAVCADHRTFFLKLLVPGERSDVVEKPGYGTSREKTGWEN